MTKPQRRNLRSAPPAIHASATAPETIALTAPIGELIEAQEGDRKLRRFSMTAYTGGAMRVFGFGTPIVVDLDGLEISAKSRPILKDHSPSMVVGHTSAIRVEGAKLKVDGVISGAGDVATEIVESSLNGFPWQSSIGAAVKSTEFIPAGQSGRANGKTFNGPVNIIRKSFLNEVSFVALGADDATDARVAAGAQQGDAPMQFKEWLKAKGFDHDALSEAQRTSLKAMYDAEVAAAADDGSEGDAPAAGGNQPGKTAKAGKATKKARTVQAAGSATATATADDDGGADDGDANADPVQATRMQISAEIKRTNKIRELCAGRHADIEAKAIEEGWTIEATELAVLRAARPNVTGVRHDNADGPSVAGTMEAALCLSAGMGEEFVGEQYDERTVDAAMSRDFQGAGLQTLFYQVIAAAGGYAPLGRMTDETIRAAFEADRQIRASAGGGFSTISLTGILSNIANKQLLKAYNAVASVVDKFCEETSHNDFKVHTRYRLTGVGVFEKVGPDGELKHAELGEDSETHQVDTYGKMISLTRQMIINDDLGGFLRIPQMIGRMSALKREQAVFELLLANANNFFHATNKNLSTGAGSALSIDGLTAASVLFKNQVDLDGHPILLMPKILLVPTSLEVTADNLMTSEHLNEGGQSNKTKEPRNNPHRKKYEVVSSPYLEAQGLAGSSAIKWWLFANPNDVAAIVISYLRGQKTPVIQNAETNFNVLGMQWRGYFDFGVGQGDHRGAVQSNGQ